MVGQRLAAVINYTLTRLQQAGCSIPLESLLTVELERNRECGISLEMAANHVQAMAADAHSFSCFVGTSRILSTTT